MHFDACFKDDGCAARGANGGKWADDAKTGFCNGDPKAGNYFDKEGGNTDNENMHSMIEL